MTVLKNKLIIASPVIALLVVFIFSLTLMPSATMKPADLPVAIVNLDEGADLPDGSKLKLGEAIAAQMGQGAAGTGDEASPVKWVGVSSYEEARKGLNEQSYYAAVIIPADFSRKQASLRSPEPQAPELEVLVNQGMNATAASMVTQMVNGMLGGMNAKLSAELFGELESQGAMLTPKQAAAIAAPIASKVTNVNEFGTSAARGNAPISLFQPIWMASIAGAAITTLVVGQTIGRAGVSRRDKLHARLAQLGIGIVIALLAGFTMAWLADGMLDLNVPSVGDMGLFLARSVLAFFLMIAAVLSWTGIQGIALFVLLLFFGAPLLSLPPEFMNGFYRDWIHSWIPMRFMVDGLRELFFFGQGFSLNGPALVLAGIAVVSFVVLLLSVMKPGGVKGAAAP
ncbi:ABC transporter permease [Paenibacillus sp. PL2-23]|uniref:YhgE/Pip domain-containing protein n=1 Tax=Paenibacillus sp. PL2-23 TaxID=2100729 RepID=UPI0030F6680B